MKKAEIKVGGLYKAKVSGAITTVRVDRIENGSDGNPRYQVTNLRSKRVLTFYSAAKFRSEAQSKPTEARPITGLSIGTNGGLTTQTTDGLKCTVCGAVAYKTPRGWQCAANSSHKSNAITVSNGGAVPGAEQRSDPIPVASDTTQISVTDSAVAAPAEIAPEMSASDTIPAVNAGFARAIAKATQPTTVIAQPPGAPTLTEEQQDILAAAQYIQAAMRGQGAEASIQLIDGQWVLVIKAGAGTGKTFTLKKLEEILLGRGQYTAFNKSLVEDSKPKFKRAAVSTTHSLAFRAVGRLYVHRLGAARVKSAQVARMLGIEDYYVPTQEVDENGKPRMKRLAASFLAGQMTQAVKRFCQSADPTITAKHLKALDGVDTVVDGVRSYENSDKINDYLLPFARKAWADLTRTDGCLPFHHDVYVKLWQLGTGTERPIIASDYILLDEAQDTAPVFLDILRQQKHALLILVGDDNQEIYAWRGAVNAMAAFKGAPCRMLSQSFRFGQAVADVANSILATLEEATELIMKGLQTIPTRVTELAEARCYLYRTNAGAVARLMQARTDGKRGHLIGGSKEVVDFCQAAVDLQNGRGTMHPELGCFADWGEVVAYSKEDEGQDLRLMVKLIDEFGAENIRDALKSMPEEKDADLILSTAHRSKGREWSSVKLGPDFPTANKLTDADRRLLYVACTRAQEELDISDCPTLAGGYDKKGGGEDGSGGGAEWIPGIPVRYTADMPTPDALAAYRGRTVQPAPTATPAAPMATRPDVAPANGNSNGQPTQATQPNRGVDPGIFTWGSVDGKWCVRGGPNMEGKRVTVTRKNGSTSTETLGAKVRIMGEFWFYAIR